MKLSAFKELLLRKVNDEELKSSIIGSSLYAIGELLIESLQKAKKGVKANESLISLANNIAVEGDTSNVPDMLRDAIGHHASRYKKALELGDSNKIDYHARSFFKLLDLSSKLSELSGGALALDAPDVHRWERNIPAHQKTFAQAMQEDEDYKNKVVDYHLKNKSGKVHDALSTPNGKKNDTKGFNIWHTNPRKTGWDFLDKAPPAGAEAYKAALKGHRGSYPMERVMINNHYIPINEVDDLYDGNNSHAFEQHPILKLKENEKGKLVPLFKISSQDPSAAQYHHEYDNDHIDWGASDTVKNFYDNFHSKGAEHAYSSLKNPGSSVHGERSVFVDPNTVDFSSEFPHEERNIGKVALKSNMRGRKKIDPEKVPSNLRDIAQITQNLTSSGQVKPPKPVPAGEIDESKIPSHLRFLIPAAKQTQQTSPSEPKVEETKQTKVGQQDIPDHLSYLLDDD